MKKFGTLVLMGVVFAACELPAPTAPQNEGVAMVGASAAIMATAEEVESYVLVLQDIRTRLLPAMEDQEFAVELKGHLEALASAMTADDDEAAYNALTSATALVELQRSKASEAKNADLGAMALDLAAANRMIGFGN